MKVNGLFMEFGEEESK